MTHARLAPAATLCALLALAPLAGCRQNPAPAPSAPTATQAPAPPPTEAATYSAGQPVHINWEGTWYAGRVLDAGTAENSGQYRIHYDGWADSWDAWVTPDKLRLPSAGVATGSRPS